MCGRFSLYSSFSEIEKYFELREGQDFSLHPSYNIAPTQETPIIFLLPDADRAIIPMPWALVPVWDQSPKPRKHFNARSETILDKPTFRDAFMHRRCLVVANGFYEWKTETTKQPYFFSMKSSELFALAAIWERRIENEKVIDGFSLITTEANAIVAPVHDRMPVIITKKNYDKWMSPNTLPAMELLELLTPYIDSEMQAYPVTPKMNKPAFNSPACIKPLD